MKTDWILVTGQPGMGKTTAVKKMVEYLQNRGVYCQGFYTEEVLSSNSGGARIGFDVVTIPEGERSVLSRKEGIKSKFKTGQYYVDVSSFEKLAIPSLSFTTGEQPEGKDTKSRPTVFVLDEIGRMELHSVPFQEHVRSMLESDLLLIGAITAPRYGHRVAYCDEVSAQNGVSVHNLTKKTRDNVLDELLKSIESRWEHILNN